MAAWAERGYAEPRRIPAAAARANTVTNAARSAIWAPTVALSLAAGALLSLRLDAPGFFDNEGRYAEIAREDAVRSDWLTPHLDFAVFLNKPPLTAWLTALVFTLAGPTEWARLVPVTAAVVALIATGRLGALLYGERVGLAACAALATSFGFVLEARTLRPDMLLTAATVLALLCWQHAPQSDGRSDRVADREYVALAVGVLAKGLVVPLVVALPVLAITLHEEGRRGLRALRPGLGVLIGAALVLPWHIAVAVRNPGFAWDYVVNQHLLFFLDRKLPRDSVGDALPFFWAAAVARALPWALLVPLAIRDAVSVREPAGRATRFLWLWLLGTLVFFSCTPARLEHYSLPALPAAALLAARAWQRLRAGEVGSAGWWTLGGSAVALIGVGAIGIIAGERLLAQAYWMAGEPALRSLAFQAAVTIAGTGVVLTAAALRRQADLVLAALLVGALGVGTVLVRAGMAVEPVFSWRPVAQALAAGVPLDTEVVFEAPDEYQLVGGLAFYTRRRITLIEPPGFVPPTYLAATAPVFVPRREIERRWSAAAPLALVSDRYGRRDGPDGLVPAPFRVVARLGDRWVLANAAASGTP